MPERDSNMGLCRMAVFEYCQAKCLPLDHHGQFFSIVYFTLNTFHMCSETFIVSPNHQDQLWRQSFLYIILIAKIVLWRLCTPLCIILCTKIRCQNYNLNLKRNTIVKSNFHCVCLDSYHPIDFPISHVCAVE